jgi:hypothetical protein
MALERFLDLIWCHAASLRIAQTSVYCDLSEYHLTIYAKIAKSKDMFQLENKSPSAAVPPSAAEPAAGIASTPHEALLVPAASFSEASAEQATRQHAIGPEQCRWIIADEDAGAEALMCGAPAERRRSFCADHCAQAYLKIVEDEGAEAETLEEEISEEKIIEEETEDEDPEQEAAE